MKRKGKIKLIFAIYLTGVFLFALPLTLFQDISFNLLNEKNLSPQSMFTQPVKPLIQITLKDLNSILARLGNWDFKQKRFQIGGSIVRAYLNIKRLQWNAYLKKELGKGDIREVKPEKKCVFCDIDEPNISFQAEGRLWKIISQKFPYVNKHGLIVSQGHEAQDMESFSDFFIDCIDHFRHFAGRLGFNSVGAGASIPHFHAHLFVHAYPIERSTKEPIVEHEEYTFSKITDYPIGGFVLSTRPENRELLKRKFKDINHYFQNVLNMPVNILAAPSRDKKKIDIYFVPRLKEFSDVLNRRFAISEIAGIVQFDDQETFEHTENLEKYMHEFYQEIDNREAIYTEDVIQGLEFWTKLTDREVKKVEEKLEKETSLQTGYGRLDNFDTFLLHMLRSSQHLDLNLDQVKYLVDFGIGGEETQDAAATTRSLYEKMYRLRSDQSQGPTVIGVDNSFYTISGAQRLLSDPRIGAQFKNLYFHHTDGDFDIAKLGIGGIDVLRIANVLVHYEGREKECIEKLLESIRPGGVIQEIASSDQTAYLYGHKGPLAIYGQFSRLMRGYNADKATPHGILQNKGLYSRELLAQVERYVLQFKEDWNDRIDERDEYQMFQLFKQYIEENNLPFELIGLTFDYDFESGQYNVREEFSERDATYYTIVFKESFYEDEIEKVFIEKPEQVILSAA